MHTSYFACDWMLCAQDRPGDKATLELAVELPQGMTTVASGRQVARRPLPGGQELHVWREARPYSAYLFSLSAGDFTQATEREGSVELAYYSDAASEAELKPLFGPPAPCCAGFRTRPACLSPTRATPRC
jgi:aminopeptidase N